MVSGQGQRRMCDLDDSSSQDSTDITSSEKASLTSVPPPRPARPLPLGSWAPRVHQHQHSVCSILLSLSLCVCWLQEAVRSLRAWLVCVFIVFSAQDRANSWMERLAGMGIWLEVSRGRKLGGRYDRRPGWSWDVGK